MRVMASDHCRCFSINQLDIDKFREQLASSGFRDAVLQYRGGFKFGLVLCTSKYTQMRVKIDSKVHIESEIEYLPNYPIEHLNRSGHSVHRELRQVFKTMLISHKSKFFPLKSCRRPRIISATNPIRTKAIEWIALAVASRLLYFMSKKRNE